MRVTLYSSDGRTELRIVQLPAPADVIVWQGRYFVPLVVNPAVLRDGLYREAVVALIGPAVKEQST